MYDTPINNENIVYFDENDFEYILEVIKKINWKFSKKIEYVDKYMYSQIILNDSFETIYIQNKKMFFIKKNQNISEALDNMILGTDITIDCSVGLSLLFLYIIKNKFGNIVINDLYQTVGEYLPIVFDNFFHAPINLFFLRSKQTRSFTHLNIEQQESILNELNPGSIIYIRGCLYYEILDNLNYESEFYHEIHDKLMDNIRIQGECLFYLGENKFISFMKYNDEYDGKYTILSFQEIITSLAEQGKEEWERLPDNMKEFFMNITIDKQFGYSFLNFKRTFDHPTDIVGIYEYIYCSCLDLKYYYDLNKLKNNSQKKIKVI